MSLSALLVGLAGAVTLALGFSALLPSDGVVRTFGIWPGVAGVTAFIGLLDGA